MLLNSQATKSAILAEMKQLARQSVAGDVVVVTFSGHGSFVPDEDNDEGDGYDECWCPYDVSENQITDDELHRILPKRREGIQWVNISDSCHSGTMLRFAPITTPPTTRAEDAPQRLVRFLPPSIFCDELCQLEQAQAARQTQAPPGRARGLLISGCQDAEYSYDAWFQGRANGAFTYVALRELRTLRPGATYREWFDAIRRSLPSQQYPQSPNLFGVSAAEEWTVFGEEPVDDSSASKPALPVGASPAMHRGQELAQNILREREMIRGQARVRAPMGAGERRQRGVSLVAMGDSWLDYPRDDVRDVLEDDFGYEIESVASAGACIEDMAYAGGQLRKLLRCIEKMIDRKKEPRAVLLSGGGNDVAGQEFAQLLNHSEATNRGLNQEVVRGVLDRIRDSYLTIIAGINALTDARLGKRIPIVIHGYDHAVPDGRGFLGGWWLLPGPWLLPGFRRKGYSDDLEMKAIVRDLIDQFNEMQRETIRAMGLSNVTHLDLRGSLSSGSNYRSDWANELHPTQPGFRRIAEQFAEELRKVAR